MWSADGASVEDRQSSPLPPSRSGPLRAPAARSSPAGGRGAVVVVGGGAVTVVVGGGAVAVAVGGGGVAVAVGGELADGGRR